MPRLSFRNSILLLPLVAGCMLGSAQHPLLGRTHPVRSEPGYWIYLEDGWLYVRVTAGEHPRRFQGSVKALRGALGKLELDRPELAEQVASQGDSVQFDLGLPRSGEEGFRVRFERACARFDLYLDGSHRPEHVHLGDRRFSPHSIPFERCP